ncbi:MAG TPA: hypothetical protein PKM44_09575 [Turneriella sp.]|nr:hypothetical protein [Turneriella sp.]HNE18176.1 hypothetical protein [Turneriella sp.]HNJ67319.1 hypothetical protein [Turneriella sp.]HNL10749.1 hypothetical protein [Turneriella sp.]HNL53923.1 hypothetical protein [Turneriella sp.]
MEYVAFLFLGLGVLLVLAGVLLQANEKRAGGRSPLEDYALQSARPETRANPLSALKTSAMPAVAAAAPVVQPAPAMSSAIPGPFQFVQHEPAAPVPVQAPAVAPVAVSVGQANPRLFEKFAYLYLDSSARNVYDGAGSVAAFDLSEVQGIRRFGRGLFSYDGFGFYFDHASGQERFPLTNLKTIGFYPNCVALTFRTSQPVALLFMEETETIRKVLETFRAEAAGNVSG